MESRTWFIKAASLSAVTVGSTLLPVMAQTEDCKKAEDQFRRVVNGLREPADCRYAFDKIVSLGPSHFEARAKLAEALCELALADDSDPVKQAKLLDESVRNYEKALTFGKELGEVYKSLGGVYWLRGRYGMARDAYNKALSLKPADKSTRAALKEVENELAGDPGTFPQAR